MQNLNLNPNPNPTTYFAVKETATYIDKCKALISGTSTTSADQQNILLLQYCMAAIENCAASVTLMNTSNYGAVACLSRPTLEFFLRGVWLRYCARSDQVESFINDEKLFSSRKNKKGGLIEHSLRSLAIDIDNILPEKAFLFPLLDLGKRLINPRIKQS